MENGNKFERLFKLWASVCKLVIEGKRDIDKVIDFLQKVVEGYGILSLSFPVFCEIEVGGKSKDELLAELAAEGIEVSEWARDIMSKPNWVPGYKERVKFTRVQVRDLGFTKSPTILQLWDRILKLGHILCQPGDGPAIQRDLKDQPLGDFFYVILIKINDDGGNPGVFEIELDDHGRRRLHSLWAYPDVRFALDCDVVFRLGN